MSHYSRAFSDGINVIMTNPAKAAKFGAGACLVVAGATVVAPAAGVAVLGAAGFGAGGVTAGSIAASAQSLIYGAFTTGVFSTLQAAGAAAVAPAAGPLIAGIGAMAGGAAVVVKNVRYG